MATSRSKCTRSWITHMTSGYCVFARCRSVATPYTTVYLEMKFPSSETSRNQRWGRQSRCLIVLERPGNSPKMLQRWYHQVTDLVIGNLTMLRLQHAYFSHSNTNHPESGGYKPNPDTPTIADRRTPCTSLCLSGFVGLPLLKNRHSKPSSMIVM